MTRCEVVEIFSREPENSQLTRKYRPLAEKSAWFGPVQLGSWTTAPRLNVRGSAKAMSSFSSSITIPCRPSGVK